MNKEAVSDPSSAIPTSSIVNSETIISAVGSANQAYDAWKEPVDLVSIGSDDERFQKSPENLKKTFLLKLNAAARLINKELGITEEEVRMATGNIIDSTIFEPIPPSLPLFPEYIYPEDKLSNEFVIEHSYDNNEITIEFKDYFLYIDEAVRGAYSIAHKEGRPVSFQFNGTKVTLKGNESADDIDRINRGYWLTDEEYFAKTPRGKALKELKSWIRQDEVIPLDTKNVTGNEDFVALILFAHEIGVIPDSLNAYKLMDTMSEKIGWLVGENKIDFGAEMVKSLVKKINAFLDETKNLI